MNTHVDVHMFACTCIGVGYGNMITNTCTCIAHTHMYMYMYYKLWYALITLTPPALLIFNSIFLFI